jgi:anti-anti-sigma factor
VLGIVYVVIFSGEYDVANKQAVRKNLRRHESSANLVLDLAKVTYVDSSFIAELIMLESARKANGFGPATIVTPLGSHVRRLFDVMGMTATLNLVASFDPLEDSESSVEYASTGDELDPLTKRR